MAIFNLFCTFFHFLYSSVSRFLYSSSVDVGKALLKTTVLLLALSSLLVLKLKRWERESFRLEFFYPNKKERWVFFLCYVRCFAWSLKNSSNRMTPDTWRWLLAQQSHEMKTKNRREKSQRNGMRWSRLYIISKLAKKLRCFAVAAPKPTSH